MCTGLVDPAAHVAARCDCMAWLQRRTAGALVAAWYLVQGRALSARWA